MRRLKWIIVFIIALLLLAAAAFVAWATLVPDPMPAALAALQSDATVTVSQESGWWVFGPAEQDSLIPA